MTQHLESAAPIRGSGSLLPDHYVKASAKGKTAPVRWYSWGPVKMTPGTLGQQHCN